MRPEPLRSSAATAASWARRRYRRRRSAFHRPDRRRREAKRRQRKARPRARLRADCSDRWERRSDPGRRGLRRRRCCCPPGDRKKMEDDFCKKGNRNINAYGTFRITTMHGSVQIVSKVCPKEDKTLTKKEIHWCF